MPLNGPSDAFVLQFETEYDLLFQQRMARLAQDVRTKDGVTGTMAAFGLLGPSDVEDITGDRHGETTFTDDPSYRRWAVRRDYETAKMLDQEDEMSVLVDLQMGYTANSVAAMNRKADKVVIDAVTATAVSGATGTGTVAYSTTTAVADGSGGNQIPSSATGLTPDKMRLARAVFDAREVGVDEVEQGMSPFVWVTTGGGHAQLLTFTEATSSDYIGVEIVNGAEIARRMPLVQGRIPYYMGFRIKISNQLNLSGTDVVNLAWHTKAMGFARWAGRQITVDRLPTRHNATGLIIKEHFGAVRVHDLGVLSILCNP